METSRQTVKLRSAGSITGVFSGVLQCPLVRCRGRQSWRLPKIANARFLIESASLASLSFHLSVYLSETNRRVQEYAFGEFLKGRPVARLRLSGSGWVSGVGSRKSPAR